MSTTYNVFKSAWAREFLIFSFLLTVSFINEREDFANDHGWIDGMFIFLLLYFHMQIHRFFILPELYKGRFLRYILFTLSGICLFTGLALTSDFYLTNVGWFDEIGHSRWYLIKFYLFSFFTTIPLLVAIHSIYLHYLNRLQLETEKRLLQEMELHLLKRQLDPHFLFNALNGLYGLSLEKPKEIPDKILQISDIMRYHVQHTNSEWVRIDTEIRFVKQFIAFEKDRQQMYIQVKEEIVVDTCAAYLKIAPLILISYIENAFKHVTRSAKGCEVSVCITVIGTALSLIVENTCIASEKSTDSLHTGLSNVRRRLELLYKDRYKLKLEQSIGSFYVELILELD